MPYHMHTFQVFTKEPYGLSYGSVRLGSVRFGSVRFGSVLFVSFRFLAVRWEQLGRQQWDRKQAGWEQDTLRREGKRRQLSGNHGWERNITRFPFPSRPVPIPSRSCPDQVFPFRLLPSVPLKYYARRKNGTPNRTAVRNCENASEDRII